MEDNIFTALETSAIGDWVALSLWAYPVLLSFHIIGLAVVVGIFSMRDLRLLGLFPTLHPTAFLTLGKLALIGFAINAISGLLLFTSQASIFVTNTAFLSKIGCITVGMVLTWIIQRRLSTELADTNSIVTTSHSTKLIALLSLTVWMGAIVAGRLIAYL